MLAFLLGSATAVTADEPTWSCVQTEQHLSIRRGDAEVLRYNIVAPEAPSAELAKYERSGYIHPIYTPRGRMVTGDFAADHPHQHGLFAAWTSASHDGRPVDFWNQQKGRGIVLHDRVISVGEQGFSVAVKHYSKDKDGTKTEILDDVWSVNAGEAEGRYVIEFSIAQTNVTSEPLVLKEYHYGGIGFRGNNAWYTNESSKALQAFVSGKREERPSLETTRHRFLTSEGKHRGDGNHTRPEWTMLYGKVDAGITGVKVSGDSENFRHPHPMRLHPSKPYFSISPCVLGEFRIEPGETYRATYRIEVFDGDVEELR
ncbi:MAG: DUF6807 family protein [Planctomycetota bacterium]